MSGPELVVAIIGLPIAGITLIGIVALVRGWSLKSHEIKLREHQMRVNERIRQDEMNAKLLHADDFGVSPAEFNQLAEEVRQLREELAKIRQDVNQWRGR